MGRPFIFFLLLVTTCCAKFNHTINGIPLDSLEPSVQTDHRQFINEGSIYCELETFKMRYSRIHGPLALLIAFYGVSTNIVSIFTLTQMDPTNSPTNVILTIITFSNILVNLGYIPYALHSCIFKNRSLNEAGTFLWAHFVFHSITVSQVC